MKANNILFDNKLILDLPTPPLNYIDRGNNQ